MDAVKYPRTYREMCISFDNCQQCSLGLNLCSDGHIRPKEYVDAVEKWAKEHPKKMTRQSKFLEMFPYALTLFGVVNIFPCNIDARKYKDDECKKFLSCEDCRRKYWREEIE